MKSFLFFILLFMLFLPCSQAALSPSGAQTEEMEVENNPRILYLGTFYVSSSGGVKETLFLEGNEQYFFVIRGSVVYGKINKSELAKMDACYEFGINWKNPALMPSIGNNAGIDACNTGFHKDHVYQSTVFQGINAVLTFWMVDISFDNNIGRLAVDLYKMKRESRPSSCVCEDRFGGGIEFFLVRDGQLIQRGLGFSECENLRKSHPQCR